MLSKLKERLLTKSEKVYLQFQSKSYPYPPIFIVGFIRSGTTIVYQYLNALYKFAFFPNIARYGNANHPFLSTYMNRCHKKYSVNFENEYGHIEGACSPSDGWEIFHRWFSYYMKPSVTKNLTELQKLVKAYEKLYNAPFLNKNNSNILRLDELHKAFPDALFIYVKRDIYQTINSVLKARKEHQIPSGNFWGVAPDPSLLEINFFKNELELVVFQYLFVEAYLNVFKNNLPKKRLLEIDFQLFCLNPYEEFVLLFSESYPIEYLKERNFVNADQFVSQSNTAKRISDELKEAIDQIVQEKNEYVTKLVMNLNTYV